MIAMDASIEDGRLFFFIINIFQCEVISANDYYLIICFDRHSRPTFKLLKVSAFLTD